MKYIIIGLSLFLVACPKTNGEQAPVESKEEIQIQQPVENADNIAKTEKVTINTGAVNHKWTLKIDGYDVPEISGRVVMPFPKDNVTSFTFAGTGALFRIDLKDVVEGEKTYEPSVVTVIYPTQKKRCSFQGFVPNKTETFEVKLKKTGDDFSATFNGSVNCGPTDGEGETKKATATGTFSS